MDWFDDAVSDADCSPTAVGSYAPGFGWPKIAVGIAHENQQNARQ